MTDTTKKCSKCGEVKLLDGFPKDKNRKDGYCYQCKSCTSKRNSIWHQNNPDKAKAKGKRYRAANSSKAVDVYREWRKINRDRVREKLSRAVLTLSDNYLKGLLSKRSDIKQTSIPKSLINLKREQLKLTRLIKEKQK